MALTRTQHAAEAERIASVIGTVPFAQLRLPEAIALAQVHALLAARPVDDSGEQLAAMRRIVASHVAEALTSSVEETRRYGRGLMGDLDEAGANIDTDVHALSERNGVGPYHFRVDGTLYSLHWQWVGSDGTAWEHTGRWSADGVPIMGADVNRPRAEVPLNTLVNTWGPLRNARDLTPGGDQ